MAEAKRPKAGRLKKRREKHAIERERTSDTPQAAAEHRKADKEYDRVA